MRETSRGIRLLAAVVAVGLMLFATGFSYAVVDDYSRRDVLPQGTSIGGIDLGGLGRAEAIDLLRRKVEQPLLQPLTAEARGKRLILDPRSLVHVDIEGTVDRALAPRGRTTLVRRIYQRVTNADVGMRIPSEVRVDAKGLEAWTAKTAKAVYEKPLDSKLSVDGDRIRISKSASGWKLDASATVVAVKDTIMAGRHQLSLPLLEMKPRITERKFARTLLVRLGQRRVRLFNGDKFVKAYPIAIGMAEWPTPQGWWKIEQKEENPTWTNPHSSWSAGMPDVIPPGPGNPLGTRAIRLTASGIAFHGTSNDASVGQAASHGCMRMHEWDIKDLFPRVEAGDQVVIVP